MGCSWCDGLGELALTLSGPPRLEDTSTSSASTWPRSRRDPTGGALSESTCIPKSCRRSVLALQWGCYEMWTPICCASTTLVGNYSWISRGTQIDRSRLLPSLVAACVMRTNCGAFKCST